MKKSQGKLRKINLLFFFISQEGDLNHHTGNHPCVSKAVK
jgi:hypothetical protein